MLIFAGLSRGEDILVVKIFLFFGNPHFHTNICSNMMGKGVNWLETGWHHTFFDTLAPLNRVILDGNVDCRPLPLGSDDTTRTSIQHVREDCLHNQKSISFTNPYITNVATRIDVNGPLKADAYSVYYYYSECIRIKLNTVW